MLYNQPALVHSLMSADRNINKDKQLEKEEKSLSETCLLRMVSTNESDDSKFEDVILNAPTTVNNKLDNPKSEANLRHRRELSQEDRASSSRTEDDLNLVSIGEFEVLPQPSHTAAKLNHLEYIQRQAMKGAKSFGNFLYSAVNTVSQTVIETSGKIKKAVRKAHILQEFDKQQDAFRRSSLSETTPEGVSPWSGCINKETAKEQCLNLSTDKRNFVRSPPDGVNFRFDFNEAYPSALAVLKEDPNIKSMRFELVPKIVNEETFWKNYFYRVDLICKANDISAVLKESENGELNECKEAEITYPEEFVKSTMQEVIELRDDRSSISPASKRTEEDWEKELETELQNFEVIKGVKDSHPLASKIDSNWEHEIDEILKEERTQ